MIGAPAGRRRSLSVFLIAGEESGDALGAGLMGAIRERAGGAVTWSGVGGSRMAGHGLRSLFPMEELALHGITEVLGKLPKLLRRVRQTVDAIAAADPDAVVLIDAPGFNLRIGKAVRRRGLRAAIVDYVSPQVWAWRPGRARSMAAYVDRLLAILPFEPEVHRNLGGPRCTYVGHPLTAQLDRLRPVAGERAPIGAGPPVLLVLPGSRRSEVGRLTAPFGDTVAMVAERLGAMELLLPAVPRLAQEIRERTASWPVKPSIVEGEEAKFAAFRRAHAALAASGTVTLELALSAVPTVVAYRLDPLVKPFRRLLRSKSIVLPNLIIDELAVPEFIDAESEPARLAATLLPLLSDTPERRAQLAAFQRVAALMDIGGETPSRRAADVVLDAVAERERKSAGG
ncbi:lipid-A-disaccharide synthase [soil metagenome]